MSFAIRNSLRSVVRRNVRNYSAAAESPLAKYQAEEAALTKHAAETTDLWRKISYYVCVPGLIACTAWVYKVEAEHAAHIEHIKHENGGELPPVPDYDHMNRRAKPFPWGMNSLFFNPHVNKDMSEAA